MSPLLRSSAALLLLLPACNSILGIGPPGQALADASEAIDVSPGCAPKGDLHEGNLVLEASGTEASAFIALPLDRTILFVSAREAEPSPTYGSAMCELLADQVHCTRGTGGTDSATSDATIRIRWTTMTFEAGVNVQRGTLALQNAVRVPLTTAPLESSFTVLTGIFAGPGNSVWGSNEFVRAVISDPETLELRNAAPGETVAWQVVTMVGASVQRGNSTLAADATEVDIALQPVDTSAALSLISYTAPNGSLVAAAGLMLTAQVGATTLAVTRQLVGPVLDIGWEVISLPYPVAHGRTVLPVGTTILVDPTNVATSGSVALASNQSLLGQAGGDTTYAEASTLDLVGEGLVTLTPTATGLELQRSTSLSAAQIDWNVVDFAHPHCQ